MIARVGAPLALGIRRDGRVCEDGFDEIVESESTRQAPTHRGQSRLVIHIANAHPGESTFQRRRQPDIFLRSPMTEQTPDTIGYHYEFRMRDTRSVRSLRISLSRR